MYSTPPTANRSVPYMKGLLHMFWKNSWLVNFSLIMGGLMVNWLLKQMFKLWEKMPNHLSLSKYAPQQSKY